jgi:serine/threonine protein kinase
VNSDEAHSTVEVHDPFADPLRDDADASSVLKPGTTLAGKYRAQQLIGVGGMGAVYEGTQLAVGRAVAIKILQPRDMRDPDARARFQREAVLLSRLQHPHVVTVHDFGISEKGLYFLVLELLGGRSLATEVGTAIEPLRAARIARQICDALAAAHKEGVVHRDLKPSNVHLIAVSRDKDFVKLLDFGIAKLFTPNADAPITAVHQRIGTPRYMSPEQAQSEIIDHRADIYALGCICYEMLTGRPPFTKKDFSEVLQQHIHEPPPRFADVRPDLAIDEQLEAIVRTMLSKRAADRFQSADAVEAALGLWAAHAATEPLQSAARASSRGPVAHDSTRAMRGQQPREAPADTIVEPPADDGLTQADVDDGLELPTTQAPAEETQLSSSSEQLVVPDEVAAVAADPVGQPTHSERAAPIIGAEPDRSRANESIEQLSPPPAAPPPRINRQIIAAGVIGTIALAISLVALLSQPSGRTRIEITGEPYSPPVASQVSVAGPADSTNAEQPTPTNAKMASSSEPHAPSLRLRSFSSEAGPIDSGELARLLKVRERDIAMCFTRTNSGRNATRSLRVRFLSSEGKQTIRAYPADASSDQFSSCISSLQPPLGLPISATQSIYLFTAEIGPGASR